MTRSVRTLLPALLVLALACQADNADDPRLIRSQIEALSSVGAERQMAVEKLRQAGMAAHEALREGPDGTAEIRKSLRARIRADRDALLRAAGLVVHEWGTLLHFQDSDNIVIGTHDDQSDLPDYVKVWTKLPVRSMPRVILKPIVYFYTNKQLRASVTIRCPNGMPTQWWPNVTRYKPERPFAKGNGEVQWHPNLARNGLLEWRNIELRPGLDPVYKPVPADSWWPIARDTDSVPLHIGDDVEKFLFYRGVSLTVPKVEVILNPLHQVTVTNRGSEPVEHVLAVHVLDGRAEARYVRQLTANEQQPLDLSISESALSLGRFIEQTRQQVQECLEEAGLFPKEAEAMTEIWKSDYFTHDGLRVFYLLPAADCANFMPLSVSPEPVSIVRTLLVQIECFTPEREAVVDGLVARLGAEGFQDREAAERLLLEGGRFIEAYLRQMFETTDDPEIRHRLKRILEKIPLAMPMG